MSDRLKYIKIFLDILAHPHITTRFSDLPWKKSLNSLTLGGRKIRTARLKGMAQERIGNHGK